MSELTDRQARAIELRESTQAQRKLLEVTDQEAPGENWAKLVAMELCSVVFMMKTGYQAPAAKIAETFCGMVGVDWRDMEAFVASQVISDE